MSDFGQMTFDCLRLRPFIPQEHLETYDRITEAALRQSLTPDLAEIVDLDFRSKCPVVELHPYSKSVA